MVAASTFCFVAVLQNDRRYSRSVRKLRIAPAFVVVVVVIIVVVRRQRSPEVQIIKWF